jgi:hypothetical protein
VIDFRPRTPEDVEVIVEADIKIKKGHASVKEIDVNSIDAHPMLLSFSPNRERVQRTQR